VICQLGIINFGQVSYSAAWWSLQVEIVFYVLVPLVAYALARAPLKWWSALSIWIGLAVVSHLMRYHIRAGSNDQNPGTLQFFVIYSPCFFVGTCLAQLDLPRRLGYVFLALGASWVLVVPPAMAYTHFPPAYALVYAGVLVLALQPGGWFWRMLSRPLMVWIGERSYSIFLIHFSTFYATNYLLSLFCPSRTLAYGILSRSIGIPLALFLAMLLFHFIERRFARGLVSAEYFWPTSYLAAAAKSGQLTSQGDEGTIVAPAAPTTGRARFP